MNNEIWKDVPEYEGSYQVSSFGNVKSFKWDKLEGRLLVLTITPNGYTKVTLRKDGVQVSKRVHKLIQSAFELGDGFIDHLNGIRNDNRLENLRVVTRRQNHQNLERHRNGKLVGVTFCKSAKRSTRSWRSTIRIDGKIVHLGMYATEMEAHEAYLAKLNEIGETL